MSFLSSIDLATLGFKSLGTNVLISDKASIYGAEKISVGNNVRIDDYCLLSAGIGGITIGNQVHIASHSLLVGQGEIKLGNYVGISSRVSVYSSTDDYSGGALTNPTIPDKFRDVKSKFVVLEDHVIVGSGSVILPGAILHRGSSVGAISLVNKILPPYIIVSGNPLRKVGTRNADLLNKLEREYEDQIRDN